MKNLLLRSDPVAWSVGQPALNPCMNPLCGCGLILWPWCFLCCDLVFIGGPLCFPPCLNRGKKYIGRADHLHPLKKHTLKKKSTAYYDWLFIGYSIKGPLLPAEQASGRSFADFCFLGNKPHSHIKREGISDVSSCEDTVLTVSVSQTVRARLRPFSPPASPVFRKSNPLSRNPISKLRVICPLTSKLSHLTSLWPCLQEALFLSEISCPGTGKSRWMMHSMG